MFFIISHFFIRFDAINKLFDRSMLSGPPGNKVRTSGKAVFTPYTMSSTEEARSPEFAVWLTTQRSSSQKERTRKRFEETAKRTRNIRWLVTIDDKAKALANMRGTDVSE